MELKCTLSRGELVLKAKDETYLAVRSYLSTHESNQKARYEMQADERDTHERKLLSAISSAVARFKSVLHRYTVEDTLSDEEDEFTLTVTISNRFVKEREKDVERLMAQYIYRQMVLEWWEANYPDSAKQYRESAEECLTRLQMLLSLAYPALTHLRRAEITSETKQSYLVNLVVYPEEVMDDIHSEILSTSLSQRSETGLPDIAMQTDELHGVEQLGRYIHQNATRITECLSAYLCGISFDKEKVETEEGMADDVEREKVVYAIRMPHSWKPTLLDSMVDHLHEYIVLKSVAKYLDPYVPNLAEKFDAEAEEERGDLKYILTMRLPGFFSRPYQPF